MPLVDLLDESFQTSEDGFLVVSEGLDPKKLLLQEVEDVLAVL